MEMRVGAHKARDTGKRVVAALLAALLLLTVLLANASRVSIRRARLSGAPDAAAAASNYLLDNTEYANLPLHLRAQRILSQALSADVSLEMYYEQASIAIARGENEKALELIETCLSYADEGHARYEDLKMKQGCLEALLGDYKSASKAFAVVLDMDPGNAQAWLLQAQLLVQEGDAAGAMEHLRQYLLLEEGDGNTLAIMAQLCYTAGAYEDALSYGDQALSKLENTAEYGALYSCMGLSALLTQQIDLAIQHLSTAIPLVDKPAQLQYYRGVCYLSKEDVASALTDFDAAIAGGETTAICYYNRGVCHLALGHVEELRADMQMVVSLNEDAELTQLAMEILGQLEGVS